MAFPSFAGIAGPDCMNDDLPFDLQTSARRSMTAIEDRVASFTNWPHGGPLRPVRMANAGFYQNRLGLDSVSCFNCDVELEGWNEHSNPITEHRRAAPNCTWNNDTYMTTYEERVASFNTWPLDIKPLPITMAAAGFYHSNKTTDAVTCNTCNLELKDWKKYDDPLQRHQQSSVFRVCAFLSAVTKPPTEYKPPTPPTTPPPISAPASIPYRCKACQKTFPSSSSFHKHRRQSHKNVGRRIGVPLKRPKVNSMGKYRVSKATKQRMKRGGRGNTDLFHSD